MAACTCRASMVASRSPVSTISPGSTSTVSRVPLIRVLRIARLPGRTIPGNSWLAGYCHARIWVTVTSGFSAGASADSGASLKQPVRSRVTANKGRLHLNSFITALSLKPVRGHNHSEADNSYRKVRPDSVNQSMRPVHGHGGPLRREDLSSGQPLLHSGGWPALWLVQLPLQILSRLARWKSLPATGSWQWPARDECAAAFAPVRPELFVPLSELQQSGPGDRNHQKASTAG